MFLPIEVRSLILGFVTDTGTLLDLVVSSSYFHEAYLTARAAILSSVLENQYGRSVLGEALLVVRADILSPRRPGNTSEHRNDERRRQIIFLLDRYRRDNAIHQMPLGQKDSDASPFITLPFSFPEALKILHLLTYLDGFVDEMSADYWDRVDPYSTHSPPTPTLSTFERSRFIRAGCRFQACCHLFGSRESPPFKPTKDSQELDDFEPVEVLSTFFALFPPWEYEEIACFHEYLEGHYLEMLKEANDDIYDGPRRSDGEVPRHHVVQGPEREGLRRATIRNHGELAFCITSEKTDTYVKLGVGFRSFYSRQCLPTLGFGFYDKVVGQDHGERAYSLSCQLDNAQYVSFADVSMLYNSTEIDLVYPADIYAQPSRGGLGQGLPVMKQATAAWIWARTRNDRATTYDNMPTMLSLRDWGFVFWDSNRSEKGHLPHEDPTLQQHVI